MVNTPFVAQHITATEEDLAGNNGIGRYIFLPGSEGRAAEIASLFENKTMRSHHRSHNLYLGQLSCEGKPFDVAVVSSGMGCPSMEIILHELYHLGGKRFLRVGTSGTLQKTVKIGDFVNVQAAVRDEDTTARYLPISVPAIASLEFVSSILIAAEKIGLAKKLHTGVVHCKSALYAREFGAGPLHVENEAYIHTLEKGGVLASEMETSTLFIQSQYYNQEVSQRSPDARVITGAVLGVVAARDVFYADKTLIQETQQNTIKLAIEAVKTLAQQELFT